MIIAQSVKEFPFELLECLNEFASKGSIDIARSFLAMSSENLYCVNEKGQPLLIIGAFSPSLLSPYKELWMYATVHFTVREVRQARRIFQDWLGKQNHRVLARCPSLKAARFLEFAGFKRIQNSDGVLIYEAQYG